MQNDQWATTDIDRFILAKQEAKGIAPNAITRKRKLIRRAYLDLIGLPPKPKDVTQFLKDESPQAFKRVVDRLHG